VYSLGKAKIMGIALVSGVVGVNKRRSEANGDDVTGVCLRQVYLYLILSHRIIRLKDNVAAFAKIIGNCCRIIPYISHKNMPILKQINMTNETSFADFVCHIFIICGKNETVVIEAATNPRTVTKSMNAPL